MQIIIPMTGYGSRFVAAGYRELKPFIPVLGKPMIEWIVTKMYPREKNFIFVCRQEHLEQFSFMQDLLMTLAPTGKIAAIQDWEKKGPVYDVMCVADMIDNKEPCIINYCDFYMSWDWKQFKKNVATRNCDGCIPCYTGFHPHLLPTNNLYASCKTDLQENLIEIREKYSFEQDKTKGKHSPGVYYFKNGITMKTYCQKMIDAGVTLNGEFYASLPYNFMVEDGLKVWVPTNVNYFCQWGTPEDLRDFIYWMGIIKNTQNQI